MINFVPAGAELEQLYTGAVWSEGPVWVPRLRAVRWSDIPNNRILQYDADTGQTSVYADPAEFTNGRTLDHDGSVIQCSHGRRAIEQDTEGKVKILTSGWEGGRFNSPNDVVVASDGSIWFTDPPYGIISDREGRVADPEYDGCYVFRFDRTTGRAEPVITDMVHPNGLAFAPDERTVYVSDTGGLQLEGGPFHIRAYDVVDSRCRNGRVLAEVRPGCADGFRVDDHGRIWTSSEDSVQILDPEGQVVGRIPVPEKVGNLCFGGEDGQDLYITASSSLYRIRVDPDAGQDR
jgi:gluconolactonase